MIWESTDNGFVSRPLWSSALLSPFIHCGAALGMASSAERDGGVVGMLILLSWFHGEK